MADHRYISIYRGAAVAQRESVRKGIEKAESFSVRYLARTNF